MRNQHTLRLIISQLVVSVCRIRLFVFVRIVTNHKYNHISQCHHYKSLNWLPFELLVQHHSLCAMYKLFKFQHTPLDPPITFDRTHSYQTRSTAFFAQSVRCQPSFAQRHFRFKATLWWNALSEKMATARNFSDNFIFALIT